jgi:hypothetical protein
VASQTSCTVCCPPNPKWQQRGGGGHPPAQQDIATGDVSSVWISRTCCTVRTPPCRSLYAPPHSGPHLLVCRRPQPHRLYSAHAAHIPSTCAPYSPMPVTQLAVGHASSRGTVQHEPCSSWAAAEARLPRQVHRAARVSHQPHPPLAAALVQSFRSVVHLHPGARCKAVGQRVTVAAPLSRRAVRLAGSTPFLAHRTPSLSRKSRARGHMAAAAAGR